MASKFRKSGRKLATMGGKTRARNIIDNDKGWKKIKNELMALRGGVGIAVGIQGAEAVEEHESVSEGAGASISVVEIGHIHEFGRGVVPERSFIRATFDENNFKVPMTKAAKAAFSGRSPIGIMMLIGERARAKILRRIKAGIPPVLKPATLARKDWDASILIDTGHLWNSITSKIRRLAEVFSIR